MSFHSRSDGKHSDEYWVMPTFCKRCNGFKLDPELVLILELCRVVEQLDVADIDLEVSMRRDGGETHDRLLM